MISTAMIFAALAPSGIDLVPSNTDPSDIAPSGINLVPNDTDPSDIDSDPPISVGDLLKAIAADPSTTDSDPPINAGADADDFSSTDLPGQGTFSLTVNNFEVTTIALGNYSSIVDPSININENPDDDPVYEDLFLSTGNNADSVEDIKNSNLIEGINFDQLTSQGYNPTEGTVIQFDIELEESAEFSFDWEFFTNENHKDFFDFLGTDFLGTDFLDTKENYEYNDFAFVAIDSEVDVFASYQTTDLVESQDSDYRYTTADFQTYSKSLGAGTHTITIGIFDEEDWGFDSGLSVQNFELTVL